MTETQRYRVRYGDGKVEHIMVEVSAARTYPGGHWHAVGFDGYNAWHLDPEPAAAAFAHHVARDRDTYVCSVTPDVRGEVPLSEAEHDWRPFPTADVVLAHNARTGGDCYGPWLRLRDPADEDCVATVEMLAVSGVDGSVGILDKDDADTAGLWRPIGRRGEAMPHP